MKPKVIKKRVAHFRLVGLPGEIVNFQEIKQLTEYMSSKGWQLVFNKTSIDGWWVEFRK